MLSVMTAEKARAADMHMISCIGISNEVLMENAANAVADAVEKRLCGKVGRVVIICGRGNNGGDGLALVHILASRSISAEALLTAAPDSLTGAARSNYDIAIKAGLNITQDENALNRADIIVDAMFGTGLSKPIVGRNADIINRANASGAYRIAVDIPSGMNADTGRIMGAVFHADETITFHAVKRGLLLTAEREYVGKLHVAPIGVISKAQRMLEESEQLIDEAFIKTLLPRRRLVSNKGSYGRALMIAGSENMPGAALMSVSAAVRAGAGITKAYIPEKSLKLFSALPEAILITRDAAINADLEWATAIGIGPGLGCGFEVGPLIENSLAAHKPTVADADALNYMARNRATLSLLHPEVVLTPHPAEMARLMELSTAQVVNDPVGAALEFSRDFNCCVALKSAVTVIASPDGRIRYNATGNPGLAKGGSGDVLTGLTLALLAQGLNAFDAVSAGAYLLGSSADKALELLGTRMLRACDAIEALTTIEYLNQEV